MKSQTPLSTPKSPRIRNAIERLRIAEHGWVIADHWEAALDSIGIAAAEDPQRLVYISTDHTRPGTFDYSLELPPRDPSEEYTPAGDGQNVTFGELFAVVMAHLSPGVEIDAAESARASAETPVDDPFTITTPKSPEIHDLVARLRLAERGWKILDYWDGIERSIGIAATSDEGRLVYIHAAEDGSGTFDYALELPPTRADQKYSPAGEGHHSTFEQLLVIVAAHLDGEDLN